MQTSVKQRFGVSGLPTIKIIRTDESVIHEQVGYSPLQPFLAMMRQAAKKAGFDVD